MTHEPSSIDPEILRQLRRDAATAAPDGARLRVAARLVSTGIAVASGATSVAGSAAAMQASGVAAGGGAALASTGLAKLFVLGMALGAATGLGAHVVSRATAPESPVVAQVAQTGTALRLPVGAVPGKFGTAPSDQVEFVDPAPVATNSAPPRERVPAPRRVAAGVTPQRVVNPTPELPSVGALEDRRARLAEQQALLDGARAALRAGEPARALHALEQHRALFPLTAFEEERSALEIRACVAAGDLARARARLAQFEQRFGASLQLSTLRQAVLERSSPPAHVTDPEPSRQIIRSTAEAR
jgi:hypothetical protein